VKGAVSNFYLCVLGASEFGGSDVVEKRLKRGSQRKSGHFTLHDQIEKSVEEQLKVEWDCESLHVGMLCKKREELL
jgi:hypothetical protein